MPTVTPPPMSSFRARELDSCMLLESWVCTHTAVSRTTVVCGTVCMLLSLTDCRASKGSSSLGPRCHIFEQPAPFQEFCVKFVCDVRGVTVELLL